MLGHLHSQHAGSPRATGNKDSGIPTPPGGRLRNAERLESRQAGQRDGRGLGMVRISRLVANLPNAKETTGRGRAEDQDEALFQGANHRKTKLNKSKAKAKAAQSTRKTTLRTFIREPVSRPKGHTAQRLPSPQGPAATQTPPRLPTPRPPLATA